MSTPTEPGRLRAEHDNLLRAYESTAACLDRYRDVLREVLDFQTYPDDDILLAHLRMVFGKHGAEPTAWRELTAAEGHPSTPPTGRTP